MKFMKERYYGKYFFYPITVRAKKFVEAFPHSNGKRKSLTSEQIDIMKEMGVPFDINEISKLQQGESNDNATGNERL